VAPGDNSNEEKRHEELRSSGAEADSEQIKMLLSGEEKNTWPVSPPQSPDPAVVNYVPDAGYEIEQADLWCEMAEAKKIAAEVLLGEADQLLWKAIATRGIAAPKRETSGLL
jgi:hypothetical protein